jgi:hypothetical protein
VRQHIGINRIKRIVDRIAHMAEQGNIAAAKLILDKVISNARDTEDAGDNAPGGITIRIENATFAATREKSTTVVEAEFTEVSK